jgi:hypothetical protein
MKRLGVLLLLAVAVTAQERPKPLPEIQTLLDAAPAAPPELAADILLKLVDSGRIPSKEQRLEIVEQAFQLAAQAKFPYMQSPAVARARHTDSSPGIRYVSLLEGLSTTGMRCRAVRAALNIDKTTALDLFRQIVVGPFPPLTCDDALAPDLSEYYLVLQEVASRAYPPKDVKEGRHFELIETAVRDVTIPPQLTPIVKLLATFPMPRDRKGALASAYGAALKRMDADPRSFGAVRVELGEAIAGLSKKLQLDEISAIPLADAFRAYLARHLQGALCAETANPKEGGIYMRQLVEDYLNAGVLAAVATADVPPLKFDELKPKAVLGGAKFSDSWREGRSREIMAQYKTLRFGTGQQQEAYNKSDPRKDGMAAFLPERLRRTPEWEAEARQFLEDLIRWSKNHDEPEVHFFHQLCMQYAGLLDIIPEGPLHDAVLQTYISYLKTSPMERESPPEWLIHVRHLFSITDATPDRLARVRAEIRRSGSLTMSLYAELTRLDAERDRAKLGSR